MGGCDSADDVLKMYSRFRSPTLAVHPKEGFQGNFYLRQIFAKHPQESSKALQRKGSRRLNASFL